MNASLFRVVTASVALSVLAGCGVQTFQPSLGVEQAGVAEASKAVLARRLIVGFSSMPSKTAIAQIEKQHGVRWVKGVNRLAMGVVETNGDVKRAMKSLSSTRGVQFVESELLPELQPYKTAPVTLRVGPKGPGQPDPQRVDQWYLDKMGVPMVWDSVKKLKPVTVAVVDTGVDLKHPDLQGVLVEGFNAAAPGTPPQDQAGHGTMTAGLVGAVANNGIGIAGVAPNAKIMPVKVGNSASSMAEAMVWAADHADMITMSMSYKPHMSGYPAAVETTKRAAEYVISKSVPMVCSMGNTGDSSKNVPSYFAGNDVPGLIAVGATDNKDKVTNFSTYGSWTSVSAPGLDIVTTALGGGYKKTAGTSFSTPLTAGVVALMLGNGAAKDPAAIKAKLQSTAVDIETPGKDDKSGAGRVDAFRAVTQ